MVRQRQPTHRFKTSHAEEAHHLAAKLVGATDAPFDPRHMLFRRLLATTSAGAAAAITASAALAQPKITLYEYGTTRSTRCRWTLKEAGLAFDALDTRPHKPEVLALNPIGKLPVAVIDGGVLTESAAISTHSRTSRPAPRAAARSLRPRARSSAPSTISGSRSRSPSSTRGGGTASSWSESPRSRRPTRSKT